MIKTITMTITIVVDTEHDHTPHVLAAAVTDAIGCWRKAPLAIIGDEEDELFTRAATLIRVHQEP
jgi:hypothetical protein